MNWITAKVKKWFRDQCREAWYEDCQPCPEHIPKTKADVMDNHSNYTVRMQSANGGTILEVSHYDHRKGEYNKDLYIVTDGSDLGTEISSILVQYKLTHS